MNLQELIEFCTSNQSNQQAIHQKLLEINGLEMSAANYVFAIDKNMLQHFYKEQWDTEDRDNMRQNDAEEWVASYFYERPILFLSLHQYISPNQQFKASTALNYYLRTMDQTEILKAIDYIFSADHLTEGIKRACQHDVMLTATLGIAILKHQNDLTQKDKAHEFLNTIVLNTIVEKYLNKNDIDNKRKAALFVVRAIYECSFNPTTLFAQPVLAKILIELTELTQASDIDTVLQKLFAAIGYREQDMKEALLCYKINYNRILGIIDSNNNLPDIKTLLTYFFVGGIYDPKAPWRENVSGHNGVVVVANRSFLEKVIQDEMLDILFSAGAYLELENQNEKDRFTMKRLMYNRNLHLKYAINNLDIPEINRLLDQGAVPPKDINVNIFEKNSESFKDYAFLSRLIQSGANGNLKDAMFKAVRYGHIPAVQIFIQAGVDVNGSEFKDRFKNISLKFYDNGAYFSTTLLWSAVNYDQEEMVRTLVRLGATNNDFKLADGFFKLHVSYHHICYVKNMSTLHLASAYTANVSITRFLLEQGADINAKTKVYNNDDESSFTSSDNALELVRTQITNLSELSDKKQLSSLKSVEKLLNIWLIFDKIINDSKINDLHTTIKTVLNEFIRHYSPSSGYSFGFSIGKNQSLPSAVTKAQLLRDHLNSLFDSNVGTDMTIEKQLMTISQGVKNLTSNISTDKLEEEEKDLIAICNRFVNYFSVKLKTAKKNDNSFRDVEMTELNLNNNGAGSSSMKNMF